MADFRPSLDPAFSAFSVPVTIPLYNGSAAPLSVQAIPLPYLLTDVAMGTELRDPRARLIYAFRRADIDTLSRGTLIEGPEMSGGPTRTWKVEEAVHVAADEFRVLVVRT